MKQHKALTRRMAEQKWVIDKVIGVAGIDTFWRITRQLTGPAGPDVEDDAASIRLAVKKWADISREFVRVAAKREAMAKKAEDMGHNITARDNYFAAAIFYGFAQWPIHEDDNEENIASR